MVTILPRIVPFDAFLARFPMGVAEKLQMDPPTNRSSSRRCGPGYFALGIVAQPYSTIAHIRR
jgi:hypothetical protein